MINTHEKLSIANSFYRRGDYQKALDIYREISINRPDWLRLIWANILLCRQMLALPIRLSVVVPVYNTEKYLEKCLHSILQQTEASLELIIINDGSTDKSLDIIHKAIQKDDRVVLIHNDKPSGNPGTPRNQGIAIARGKYLGFVDSDDWVDSDYFAQLLAVIEKDDLDMVFASGYTNHINGESKTVLYSSDHFRGSNSKLHGYHPSFMIWDKVYKTNRIKLHAIRLGETKAAVDVPFIFKAYYWLKKAGFADTKGYHYRRESDSSVTVNFRKSSNCDFEIQAYKDVEKWCQNFNVSIQYQNLVKYRKVSSYIYALSVISLDKFHGFYAKIKPELGAIDEDLIAKISQKLTRPSVLEKFKAITMGHADSYLRRYRQDFVTQVQLIDSKPVISKEEITSNQQSSIIPTVEIDGANKGILFFPDFSQRNPYQKLFYASLGQNYNLRIQGYRPEHFLKEVLEKNQKKFSFIHLSWLHSLMDITEEDGANDLLLKLEYAKTLGYKIIYTAHNILSHDSQFLERERMFRKNIVKYFDHILVHGQLAKERIIEEIGADERKIHIMPHGTYQGYYPNHVTQEAARLKLGIPKNKFVFLFFGNVKGYKGIDSLLEAYSKLRSLRNDIVLVIAGRMFDKVSASKISDYAKVDPSILLKKGFIEERDVQYYFNAANLMVLPYKRILTSGAAMLGITFECPVLAPRSGLIPELIQDGQQGYLFDDYAEMLKLMKLSVEQYCNDAKAWSSSFNFSDLNSRLRWPILTAHSAFSQIFSAKPRTQDFSQQQSKYRYALLRILGNDIPMRHDPDQTYNNLRFTLEHEKEFDNCLKVWILNRIVDQEKRQKLIDLLTLHGKVYVDIPYKAKELAKAGYCFYDLPSDDYKLTDKFSSLDDRDKIIVDTAILRLKSNYIINNNGARNKALQVGMQHADWVFPWDGNCFLSEQAWNSITSTLKQRADLQYHIVPMERLLNNRDVLCANHHPNPIEEPQVIFRKDVTIRFNQWLMYGLQPKVELLKRLGVAGIWDNWKRLYPWEYISIKHGSYTYNYSWAGWVSRLFSGSHHQELDAKNRAMAREKGVVQFITNIDRSYSYRNFKNSNLVFYDEALLNKIRTKHSNIKSDPFSKTLFHLKSNANKFLSNPLYSVVDKTTLPPSGDKRDYWHPAPYSWPNPNTADGLPYIFKDDERVPGTRMYEKESNKYDRTSIQRVFDETTALALAGYIYSNETYMEKASKLIRTWFIEDKTAMNPHLTYSQVIMGRNKNRGTASGLIETKDMYFFLDAVRLVKKSQFWSKEDDHKMDNWCKRFLHWLKTSDQGQQEVATLNNHGVAFDLQTYALAAYIGDVDEMYAIFLRALSRLKGHVDKKGVQPHEIKRTTTAHYTAFNLHLWFNLSILLRSTIDLNLFCEERDYEGVRFSPLKKAASWVLDRAAGDWPFQQIDKFDKDRYQHLYHTASRFSPAIRDKFQDIIADFEDAKVVFFPHDGIAPYWTLQQ